ncbi:MAG: hypothetical protein ACYC0X_07805 [Pirellulaceae bacterium]
MQHTKILVAGLLLLLLIGGCDEDNENAQVARVAEEAAARQAEQNQEMAKLNREVAAGAHSLVEADSKARQEVIAAQKDLAQQQASLAEQHDALEAERRSMAQQRYHESLLVPVISTLGLLLLCCLPLGLAWYLLHAWHREAQDEIVLGQLLVEELVSPRPVLLPGPVLLPAIEHTPHRERLVGPAEPPCGESTDPS